MAWRMRGPYSPVRLPCSHAISKTVAERIYSLRQQQAALEEGANVLPNARCPICSDPWLLPETLPPAQDIIRRVLGARRGRLSLSLPVRRTLIPPPP
jgi:hypothetical protein